MSTEREIGRRIRLEREAVGLTLSQMAVKLGVSPETLGRWETGSRRIDADNIPPIAKALGITVARLYGEIAA